MSYIGTIVGGAMQSIASGLEQQAMQNAFAAEMARQQGYDTQAYGAFQSSLPGQSTEQATKDISQGQQTREQDYGRLQSTPLLASGGGMPTGTDAAALSLSDISRAKIGGYGDWRMNQIINNIRTRDTLNKISHFAAGTASVFPYQMFAAQHSQDELNQWGQMISALGGGSLNLGSGNYAPPSDNQFAAFNSGQGPVSSSFADTWANQPVYGSGTMQLGAGNVGAGTAGLNFGF